VEYRFGFRWTTTSSGVFVEEAMKRYDRRTTRTYVVGVDLGNGLPN
jgi:hypothetical protein